MDPKLRIRAIRLLHKMDCRPGYSAELGISGVLTKRQLTEHKPTKKAL